MSESTFDLIETTNQICRNAKFGWDYIYQESTESTNDYSKENCEDFAKPTLIVAKHQTAGRGRGDNKWLDAGEGRAFLSTWTNRLNKTAPQPGWTLGVGLYLFESLSEAFPSVRFSMKAPNDICIGDKKVGGLLVEATSVGSTHFLHVGLGLNVFSYPAELGAAATHLNAYLGSEQLNPDSWADFLNFFGNSLLHMETKIANSTKGWLPQMSNRLTSALNRHPMYQANPVKAIQADGSLTLESGEISWKEL